MKAVSIGGKIGRDTAAAVLVASGKEKTDLGDTEEEYTEFNVHLD